MRLVRKHSELRVYWQYQRQGTEKKMADEEVGMRCILSKSTNRQAYQGEWKEFQHQLIHIQARQ